ncbi:FKBP-type peptidyl-prolyl cis-trans isomerase [Sphingobacterium gobiense]|uniref:Peptidyl-prolyl cis-trans isomerase n=1 Tax=Sphingobacterium gobiense TaxID=1382456 RepID=A0A2S9JSY0_9SPHI|nr:FKBP-type peptidyl-prolyl cis-trans isomerase [Sphingobacterium gobiense]PRD56392.1 peptidylprolyl isomerase [Sphingobacterium gobiense]
MNIKQIGFAMLATTFTSALTAQAQVLKTDTDSVSYALGKDVGSSLTSNGIILSSESFLRGVQDAIAGNEGLIGEEEGIRMIKTAFAKAAEERIEGFKKEETAFFDTIKKKSGVRYFEDGLYYEVIQEGSGAKPTRDDEVTVHYKGVLANGKVFDNSYERGEPLNIDLANVIRGWQLGIPLMSSGAKYRLYIPSTLGYGERGAGADIPPYSPLIFEIELIGIKSQETVM